VGAALGEHLGYLFASTWSTLVSIAMSQCPLFPPWLGWLGLIPAAGVFLRLFEETSFKAARVVSAISHALWTTWLIADGLLPLF